MKRSIILSCLTMALALMIACQSEPTDPTLPEVTKDVPETLEADEKTGGEKLAQIDYEDGSFIAFYEAEPGEILIRNSKLLPEEEDEAVLKVQESRDILLDDLSSEGKSLVEIYSALSSETDEDALIALEAAEIRRQETMALAAEQEGEGETEPETETQYGEIPADAKAEGCTPDYYRDNYAKQWFLDRYCVQGNYRWCPTNVTWVKTGSRKTKWIKICAMAPDFATGVQFTGYLRDRYCFGPFWTNCHWISGVNWDFTIMPRRVECYTYTGSKRMHADAIGLDPCKRVHLSELYNQ